MEIAVESYVTELISDLVEQDKFFVFVKATLAETQAAADQNESPSENQTQLPFTSLQIDLDKLKQNLSGVSDDLSSFSGKSISFANLELEIVFDETIPDAKTRLVENLVTHRLKLSEQGKTINVRKEKIVADPVIPQPPTDPTDLELEQVKNERLSVEIERSRFEAAQEAAELKKEQERIQAEKNQEIEELRRKHQEDLNKLEATNASGAAENPLGILESLQFIFVAIILGVLLLVGIVLFSGAYKKGLTGVSSAIGNIGDAITASAASLSNPAAPISSDLDSDAAEEPSQTNNTTEDNKNDPEFLKFISIVEEKIQVLSSEGNLNFYRHFADMVQNRTSFAAALMVAVGPKTAKILADNLSHTDISRIKDALESSGGLEKAYRNRAQALQDFYGRIAMDEYTGSPISKLKDAAWISRLSNAELAELLLGLESDHRIGMLSILTPTRIGMILNSIEANDQRATIMAALKEVETIDPNNLDQHLKAAEQKHKANLEKSTKEVGRMFDTPRFFAKVIDKLHPEQKNELFSLVAERDDLIEAIRRYYIPFSDIILVSDAIVLEIFEKKPALQIATILYGANESIRERVLDIIPERLKDNVVEELEGLESDTARTKQNLKESQFLQDEVAKYLLSLNKQGMLERQADSDTALAS